MREYFTRKNLLPLILFLFLDILAVGMGMGVPIFAILLGFLVGWISPAILQNMAKSDRQLLRLSLNIAFLTSGFTFVLMLVIWGPPARMMFDPVADFANFGMPLFLYEPKASFIGWIILMVFISPFLQILATVFGSVVRLTWFPPEFKSDHTE